MKKYFLIYEIFYSFYFLFYSIFYQNLFITYWLFAMKSWVNRKRIGDHKHTTKQERKNFNRRYYSTSITPSYPVLNTNTENLDLQTNKWLHLKVKENYFQFVNENAIEYVMHQFWARIMNNLEDDQFVLVLFRVIYNDFIMTLGEMQKVNKNDLYKITELYKKLFELKDEHYKTSEVKSSVISYNIIPDYKLKSNKSLLDITEKIIKE